MVLNTFYVSPKPKPDTDTCINVECRPDTLEPVIPRRLTLKRRPPIVNPKIDTPKFAKEICPLVSYLRPTYLILSMHLGRGPF